MLFVDTHTHLYLEEFDTGRDEIVRAAIEAGVEYLFLPQIDSQTYSPMMNLCQQFPNNCFPMMGLHPTSVKENYRQELRFVEKQLADINYIAIGEIGIDLYWDKSRLKEQQEAFRLQLKWAKELQLPVSIHIREAFDEVFSVLEHEANDQLRGVFHSFTGNEEQAKRALEYGFLLGVGGIFTFKNSGLDKIIENVDLEKLILETDSPYLAPTPKRGKRNESAYIIYIAQKLAELKQIQLDELAEQTTLNAFNLFKKVKK